MENPPIPPSHPRSPEFRPSAKLPRHGDDPSSRGTRVSLVRRLRDLGDDESWAEFHATYSRLVRNVALRSGLNEVEAGDVVQETWISVARKMPTFRYEPGRDSFKGWLLHMTRFRIADQFRRRFAADAPRSADSEAASASPSASASGQNEEPPVGDGTGCAPELESLWDAEWNEALTSEALRRVRGKVRPEHFEVFHLAVLRQQPLREVARALGVSLPRVYLAKHRVGRAMQEAIRAVREEWL